MVYFWVGFVVVWGLVALVTGVVFYLIPWRFAGYVIGFYRIARLSRVKSDYPPKLWVVVKWAWRHTLGMDDSWFREINGLEVPLYGFSKVKELHS